MDDKLYITSQELLEDSFRLGAEIASSGFRPNMIIAIWRGGTPMGIAIQEFLAWSGITADHIAIRTSSYSGIDNRASEVRVHGMNYVIKKIRHDDALLIVDDVFDTGLTIDAVIRHLGEKARRNTPEQIRVAVPWFKPTHNRTDRVPDYYLRTTDRWLMFPHSLEGLSVEEIRANRPALYKIISPALQSQS